MHENARLTPRGRERRVRHMLNGQSPDPLHEAQASPANGVQGARFLVEGVEGLQDRNGQEFRVRGHDDGMGRIVT